MAKRIMMAITGSFIALFIITGTTWAQSWDIHLSAGSDSATGGVHYRQFVETGFIKVGGTALHFTDDDDVSCQTVTFDFFVGSDTLNPGLTLEVGLRGILGSLEDENHKGDLGGVAFAGNVEYFFSPTSFPLPVEIFGGLTYGPESLSFQDYESYMEFTMGTGVRIGRSASVRLSYTTYNIDMDNWSVDSNGLRLGLVMRF